MKIDNIDIKILELLSKDPKLSFRNIALKVGTSTPTVIEKIKKMEKNGIIKGYFTNIDFKQLDQHKEIFIIKCKRDFLKNLEENENIRRIFKVEGNRYIIIFVYENVDKLEEFLNTLDSNDIEYERFLVLNELKFLEEYFIPQNLKKLTCDYCGGDIRGIPITKKINGETKYFCCRACKDDYIKRYEKFKAMVQE